MTAPVRGEPVRLDPPGPEPVGLGRYGEFGGRFVPETLVPALEDLERDFRTAWADDGFRAEYADLLTNYAGRPTPVTRATAGWTRRSTVPGPAGAGSGRTARPVSSRR